MDIAIKQKLFDACKQVVEEQVQSAKEAMEIAQGSANEEKGMMGDKFESFREQMQIERDRHAERYDKALQARAELNKLDPSLTKTLVSLGAIVLTDHMNFFISTSVGAVVTDTLSVMAISTNTPLFKEMAGKAKGGNFQFRDKIYLIKDVF